MSLEFDLLSFSVIDIVSQNPLAITVNNTRLRLPHGCEDGGMGIAVFIGLLPEEHVARIKAAREAQLAAEDQANKDKYKASSSN